jgi:hypothetical protein
MTDMPVTAGAYDLINTPVALRSSRLNAWYALIILAEGLLLLSRSIVWGPEISLFDLESYALGLLPFTFLGVGLKVRRTRIAVARLSKFLTAGWIVSLLSFIILRTTFWADYFEDPIYDAVHGEIVRYTLLAAIYSVIGYALVISSCMAWCRFRRGPNAVTWSGPALGLAGNTLFFTLCVFLIQD